MNWLEVTKEKRQIIGFPLTFLGIIKLLTQLTFCKRNFLTQEHELIKIKELPMPENSVPNNTFENYSANHSTDIMRTNMSNTRT